jgi:short-subunit dehydrogenase
MSTTANGTINGRTAVITGAGSGIGQAVARRLAAHVRDRQGLMAFAAEVTDWAPASKFAVRGDTEALRQELRGTGVRAATVHPGGVKTNIVANARYRADHRGEHADVESAAAAFADIARTTPEKAAKIIHKGIEDGRPRIRIGPDAVMFDLLARLTPNRYYDVIERLETLLRRAS